MTLSAQGTQLSTSLKDLQKLGVDTVLLSGSDSLTVNLGAGEEGLSGSGIPLFGDAKASLQKLVNEVKSL